MGVIWSHAGMLLGFVLPLRVAVARWLVAAGCWLAGWQQEGRAVQQRTMLWGVVLSPRRLFTARYRTVAVQLYRYLSSYIVHVAS